MTSTTPLAGSAELYERHYEAAFRAALRVTGNPADAEDVLQTVFLRVLARGGNVEGLALPTAYFRRAAVNAAVDVLRRRELHAESAYDERAPQVAVQPPLLLKERLRRAIAALDSEARACSSSTISDVSSSGFEPGEIDHGRVHDGGGEDGRPTLIPRDDVGGEIKRVVLRAARDLRRVEAHHFAVTHDANDRTHRSAKTRPCLKAFAVGP
jgi:RNA polymerase sigma factor (sigma-70 family)